ncbi:GGDEF domain-containing protein [Micromonospora sp. PPF5-17]|uniref:GGDEF domain-containing protein n=1 Tax=Micromonospora solifontis TaxID=2487138 RepID=A0ABX9WJH6_9ACTN|nr:GGDEF domain-containing protein [Micromonospora sp. PPF5-17B]NES35718.1 GGDEF domain-containing protein [Micromonospora solifontis]NES56035.1 GGDEF domain-containing protein [Micromonospora sp. PPF5-6]RNM00395.1 GGDEF domain-containing protein [Micromonospora solifontis]
MSLAGALFVLAGAVGLAPARSAAALAVAAGCALACVRLAWLAGAAPAPDGRRTRRIALSRRAAALLDAAVLVAGLTVAVLPLTAASYRLPVAVGGLALSTPLYAVALLRLPGRSRLSRAERLRRTVDVLGLAISLFFAFVVLRPPGPVPAAARVVTAGAAIGLAVLLVGALTERRRRPGAARCLGGAAATLAGLALLVVLLAHDAPAGATLAVAPPLLLGALLTEAGARRTAAGERAGSDDAPAAWPGLTAPAAIAALAAGHHLSTVGEFTAPAMALGLAVIPPMVLREVLAAADHRRRAERLAAHEARLRALAGAARPAVPDRGADPLAPLADRRELLRRLVGREGGALLVVDLLGLEDGTEVAAPVLAEAARRLRAGPGRGDLVARLDGAEFAVLTDVGPVLAYALGTRLVAALAEPYPSGGGPSRLRVAVGLAETTGGDPEDVLRQAELARRRAVQLGGDRVEWYDAYLEEQLVRRLDLERELPGAVARGELDLVYQPVLALADRLPVGTEALLRWRSPVLGTVLPEELLPVAADLDLLGEVGRWVLDRACRQLADWSDGRRLWMAVNVTPRELAAPDFVARTATALAAYEVPPERLVVEVAEPVVAAELPTVVARFAGLRSLGVRTALDDFRAEHASLAQLRRLPIDLLKVGPHLVGPAPDGQRPLIDVVANLGDRLGLEVVVEGLESDAQVAGARRAGCRYGQGFALARPATAERVEAWFEEFPTPR